MQWFIKVVKEYAVFNGRAHRTEFWMFTLFYLIFYVVLAVAESFITGTALLAFIFSLALLIPSIAVTVRRLHDTDRSGWWFLIVFVPLIGAIVLLIFMVMESGQGENRFGPSPHAT